jgi:hypothetical protein
LTAVLLALGIATLGAVGASGSADTFWNPGGEPQRATRTLKFDVAEDMTRFAFDPDHAYEEDGLPAHGSFFVTQGYIYPEGTLDGSNGVNPDGSPEFPELVIGSWTCYGTFIGEGAHASSGAMVLTTQIYNFGDELGDQMIVSDGYELADVGVPIQRAITGGTDEYDDARGEVTQRFLGFNASEGFNLTYELEVHMD